MSSSQDNHSLRVSRTRPGGQRREELRNGSAPRTTSEVSWRRNHNAGRPEQAARPSRYRPRPRSPPIDPEQQDRRQRSPRQQAGQSRSVSGHYYQGDRPRSPEPSRRSRSRYSPVASNQRNERFRTLSPRRQERRPRSPLRYLDTWQPRYQSQERRRDRSRSQERQRENSRSEGYASISELIEAGVSITDLLKARVPIPDLLKAGVTVKSLLDAGVAVGDLVGPRSQGPQHPEASHEDVPAPFL